MKHFSVSQTSSEQVCVHVWVCASVGVHTCSGVRATAVEVKSAAVPTLLSSPENSNWRRKGRR